ncbi:MAG: hypothetical protein RLZZ227_134 [Pseudomonadota bacterium]|jgi:outer membrane protein TolC
MIRLTIASLLAFGLCLDASAQAQAPRRVDVAPTTLDALIASSLAHFPEILATSAEVEGRQQLAFAAEGAFDPRIEGGAGYLAGNQDAQSLDAGVYQDLPFANARLFAGYDLADKDSPGYDYAELAGDKREARVGFSVSLLRDRAIDQRRAAITSTRLDVRSEQQQLTLERLRVLQQAYVTYAQWLLATRLHDSYAELLKLAEDRGVALERRVAAGDAPEILLAENRQAILQRQGLLVDAQRQIDMAAEAVAFYLRDEQGATVYPRYSSELELPVENPADFDVPVEELLDRVLALRPEISSARIAREQAGLKLQLAENLGKPRVDLRFYTARGSRDGLTGYEGTDQVVDLMFAIPLRTREARGKASAAHAEMATLDYRIRQMNDQVELDIRRALVNLDATRQLEDFAINELALSETLATAESRRFDAGLSDFFLLNIRERQVGEAQLKRWQAHLAHHVALASFYVVSMNLEGLGVRSDAAAGGAF